MNAMLLPMDPGEIARDYNAAINKRKQIGILADLNGCKRQKIIDILRQQGIEPEVRKYTRHDPALPAAVPEPDDTVSQIPETAEADPVPILQNPEVEAVTESKTVTLEITAEQASLMSDIIRRTIVKCELEMDSLFTQKDNIEEKIRTQDALWIALDALRSKFEVVKNEC